MPLTPLQLDIFSAIAANRSMVSFVAGGTALSRQSLRKSLDIDVFHRDSVEMLTASDSDTCLRAARLIVAIDEKFENFGNVAQAFRRAHVSRNGEVSELEWAVDTDFRFFQPIADPQFRYVLNPNDIGVNKVLAAVNRSEFRDVFDLVEISRRYLSIAALVSAATAIDAGWSPEGMINEMSRNTRRTPDAYDGLRNLKHETAYVMVADYHQALRQARAYVARLPSSAFGKIYLADGQPVEADPDRLDTYQTHLPLRGGHWPTMPGVINDMLAERHGIAWDRPGIADTRQTS
jgi:hypothetical protein